jgi:type IV secretion system protein VirB8
MIFWDKSKHLQEEEKDGEKQESEVKSEPSTPAEAVSTTETKPDKVTEKKKKEPKETPKSTQPSEPPPSESDNNAKLDKKPAAETPAEPKKVEKDNSKVEEDVKEPTIEVPTVIEGNDKKEQEIVVEYYNEEPEKKDIKNGKGSSKQTSNETKPLKDHVNYKSWYDDSYETVLTQRNILFIAMAICIVTILSSIFLIRFIKNRQNIEPFVIEIEEKTGVPTVVEPVGTEVYSANEAVQKYFIMQYIRAREEYYPALFDYNYETVVRVLSDQRVYYNDYRPLFSKANPTSPYNLYGQTSFRKVLLKSLIFRSDGVALVRVAFDITGAINMRQDKIILIGFTFKNIEMNDEERLINPLGFVVTLYRIEDDKV